MIKLTNLFVSLFYSGYIKILPSGTFGSFISILILFPLIEFNFISLESFDPIVIVLALADVPILIAPVLLSVPNPIVPPEESIVKFPSLWISIKPVPPPLFIAEINLKKKDFPL